jgi:pyruvate dehydrogenase E1 component beta subunit
MLAAVNDPDPMIYIDERWLYEVEDDVPEGYYETPIGKANVLKEGTDVTIVAASFMVKEALKAAEILADDHISFEVIDLRTLKPVDMETVNQSVAKTKKAVVTIAEWAFASVTDSVARGIYEANFGILSAPVKTVTLPNCPAPASKSLEAAYYIYANDIVKAVKEVVG